jgi:saccharopine dehydrogenase (NAD+, L-lysine-forming)
LIDYETLTDKNKHRIIGFGRYAGIVGCYNGFLAYGKKHNLYTLKPANLCADKKEMESELSKIKLPIDMKIVMTGSGRVGGGAQEILDLVGIKQVSPESFLNDQFDKPVYTQLDASDYYAKADGSPIDIAAFHKSGAGHISTFSRYLKVAQLYLPCHYWSSSSPVIVTREDLAHQIRRQQSFQIFHATLPHLLRLPFAHLLLLILFTGTIQKREQKLTS